jgi:DegV family protein with EDD domain
VASRRSDKFARVTIRIVTDSASDLPAEVAAELGIEIVPLTIRFGAEEFVDRRDLTPEVFWRRCAESATLPETAAPAPGAFEQTYRELAAAGATGVVVVALSAALSATMQSAELAARAVSDVIRVTVVDSRSVTLGQGMIAVAAARLAASGADHDEVVEAAHSLAGRTKVWGALDTLDNLKKGGRIGGAKALLASVLSIKPIIEVRDGKVEEGGKQRTRSKALAFLVDKVRSYGEIDNLAVLHANCPDVEGFVAQVRPLASGEVIVGNIGPVVGSHAGVGTIGVAFQTRR